MDNKKVIAFAKGNHYDGDEYLCEWREFLVYEPIFISDDGEPDFNCSGPPLVILVKGGSDSIINCRRSIPANA